MASDQVAKRLSNQCAVLKALNAEGSLRRSDLSRRLAIRKSSVTSIVGGLLERGVLKEDRPGNMRSPVGLNHRAFYAGVASLTPSRIEFARVDLAGRIQHREEIALPTKAEPRVVVDRIAEGLAAVARDGGGDCIGLGLSAPGIVDSRRGVCVHAVNLHQWRDVPVAEMLSARLAVDVFVENDVRCQLWSCAWFDGWARDAENIIYVLIAEGVACSMMTRGRLNMGDRYSAGEIGHVRIGDEGRLCSCGRSDCLETYCSVPVISREIRSISSDLVARGAADIARLAKESPVVSNVLDRTVQHLARALSGLVAAIDPAVVILGTESAELSAMLKPMLDRHLYNELMGLQASEAEIRGIGHADDCALRGIAGMVTSASYETGVFSVCPGGGGRPL